MITPVSVLHDRGTNNDSGMLASAHLISGILPSARAERIIAKVLASAMPDVKAKNVRLDIAFVILVPFSTFPAPDG
jgi:hypothetical protein